MCDDAAFDDMIEHNLRQGGISRRELGALALGAGITFALPPVFGFFTLQYLRREGYA